MSRGHIAQTHDRSVYADVQHCTICRAIAHKQSEPQRAEEARKRALIEEQRSRLRAEVAAKNAERAEAQRKLDAARRARRAGMSPLGRWLNSLGHFTGIAFGVVLITVLGVFLALCAFWILGVVLRVLM